MVLLALHVSKAGSEDHGRVSMITVHSATLSGPIDTICHMLALVTRTLGVTRSSEHELKTCCAMSARPYSEREQQSSFPEDGISDSWGPLWHSHTAQPTALAWHRSTCRVRAKQSRSPLKPAQSNRTPPEQRKQQRQMETKGHGQGPSAFSISPVNHASASNCLAPTRVLLLTSSKLKRCAVRPIITLALLATYRQVYDKAWGLLLGEKEVTITINAHNICWPATPTMSSARKKHLLLLSRPLQRV